mgnify:CR=1 FL=1
MPKKKINTKKRKKKNYSVKALQEKFDEDPEEQNTKYYCYGGWEQSARKREFNEQGGCWYIS